jgi:hypothetical protein
MQGKAGRIITQGAAAETAVATAFREMQGWSRIKFAGERKTGGSDGLRSESGGKAREGATKPLNCLGRFLSGEFCPAYEGRRE